VIGIRARLVAPARLQLLPKTAPAAAHAGDLHAWGTSHLFISRFVEIRPVRSVGFAISGPDEIEDEIRNLFVTLDL
jgi:hypothetical protein